jgi:hypothetical protein
MSSGLNRFIKTYHHRLVNQETNDDVFLAISYSKIHRIKILLID